MQKAMDETNRRRRIQQEYNQVHGITPQTIHKEIRHGLEVELRARRTARDLVAASDDQFETQELIRMLEEEMLEAAHDLEFEKAAQIRDKLKELRGQAAAAGDPDAPQAAAEHDRQLAQAIDQGIANRLANRPHATSQQKKIRRRSRGR